MRNPLKILILTGCISICSNSFAGSGVADAIFKAEQFSYDTLSPLVRNEEISVDWPDGDRFFHYSLEDSSGVRHFVVSTRTWKKEMVFDSGVMSSRIAGLLENEREGVATPDGPLFIYSVTFEDGNPYRVIFNYGGRTFRYDCRKDILEKTTPSGEHRFSGGNRDWYKNWSSDSLYVCRRP